MKFVGITQSLTLLICGSTLLISRGHQRQAVAAGKGVFDDRLLLAAETFVSEDPLEHVPGRRGHGTGLSN